MIIILIEKLIELRKGRTKLDVPIEIFVWWDNRVGSVEGPFYFCHITFIR